jgi:hypothetical protein
MAVTAVHLQFTRMESVAEWNRLLGAIACVQSYRVGGTQKQDTTIKHTASN